MAGKLLAPIIEYDEASGFDYIIEILKLHPQGIDIDLKEKKKKK